LRDCVPGQGIELKPGDLQFLSQLIQDRSGLVLSPDRLYLLESRLMAVARKKGKKGLEDLIAALRTGGDEALARDVTEAMTTNESSFFRDIEPFELLRAKVLPQLLKNRAATKSFRIWCAAASSGQEPYTVAMVLKEEAARLAGWRHEIVATDISTEMLSKAKAGLYSQFEVQRGLPVQYLIKYFKKQDDLWRIDAALRGMVRYEEFNLLDTPQGLGQFDVVFCRNVLIYFDQETQAAVLGRIADLIPSDGVLFLGGAETVSGLSERFEPMAGQGGVFRRCGA
jgi:chemotaxis protein methyltransferase CheR